MSSNSTWEKFQSATLALARGAPIKERITQAYREYLSQVSEDELPKDMREEFRTLCHALTRERPLLRGEDAFRATVRKMSSEQAEAISCTVVRMFCTLPRNAAMSVRAGSAVAAGRAKSSAQIVPLYIAEA